MIQVYRVGEDHIYERQRKHWEKNRQFDQKW